MKTFLRQFLRKLTPYFTRAEAEANESAYIFLSRANQNDNTSTGPPRFVRHGGLRASLPRQAGTGRRLGRVFAFIRYSSLLKSPVSGGKSSS